MNSHGQGSSSRRRRVESQKPPKVAHVKGNHAMEASSIDSDTYSSSPDLSSHSDTRYPVRHSAMASPSNTAPFAVSTPSSSQSKDKHLASQQVNISPPTTLSSTFQSPHSPLGPSMLSSSSYKSINLSSGISDGDHHEPARLITYTKHSQGFTWNDEIFIPSYLVNRHRYGSGFRGGMKRHHNYNDDGMADEDDDIGDFDEQADQCPVTDIFVTDEEAAAMMP